ncbi:MAG: integrase family protein [Candidatus Magnetoglobus multicellularis str. Araruama]|uniref:Integrase family protein n=1 Tax=Candidatus Magnetoglobus multicellularis str. Araruama TaxID=890399 RepID=A0A1V1P3P0_9BACT|nr:MAG: integrase family protein [Candidatus Magnetoglobus multicellularis str. Araruama]
MSFIETSTGLKLLGNYLKQFKPSSRKVVKSDISNFFRENPGDILEISDNNISAYFSSLNASQKSIARKISVLKRFFSYLEKKIKGFTNPISNKYGSQLKYQGYYYQSERFQKDLIKWEQNTIVRSETIDTYKMHIISFFRWHKDTPRAITFEKMQQYIKWIKSKYSASTVCLKYTSLNSFLKYHLGSRAKDIMSFRRLKLVPPKKDKGYYDVLQESEIQQLLSQPDESAIGIRDSLIMHLLCVYGLRANEVCKITYGDLERHRVKGQQKLWIRDRKGRAGKRAETAIILNGKSLRALDDWLEESDINVYDDAPLFHQFIWDFQKSDIVPDKKRISEKLHLTVRTIETIVEKYVRQAGLRSNFTISPHALRHSALTLLAKSGVDLVDLKYLAGHQDVSTTMIYIHSVQSYDDHVGMYHPLNKE